MNPFPSPSPRNRFAVWTSWAAASVFPTAVLTCSGRYAFHWSLLLRSTDRRSFALVVGRASYCGVYYGGGATEATHVVQIYDEE